MTYVTQKYGYDESIPKFEFPLKFNTDLRADLREINTFIEGHMKIIREDFENKIIGTPKIDLEEIRKKVLEYFL